MNAFLILAALFGGIAVIIQPFLGITAVLLLSPIKTAGSSILLLAKLAGFLTIVVVFLRRSQQHQKVCWTGLEVPVFVMGAGMALSFFRTTNIGAVFDALLSLVSLYALSLVIVNLIDSEKLLTNLALVYLVSGIYPIIQAVIQRSEGPTYAGQEFVRVSGTFTLATGMGGFLIPYILVATSLLFYPGLHRLVRLFVIGAFMAGYVALIFTVSRGALASTLMGFGLVLFMLRPVLQKRGPIMVFLAVIILVVITRQYWSSVQGRLVEPVANFLNTGTTFDDNVSSRDEEMRLLIPITLDNGFMGTGIGNYPAAAFRYRYIYNAPTLPFDPHNILLYLFGEVGIVTAIGFFAMMFALFKRAFTFYRIALEKTTSIAYYMFVSSLSAIIGYSIFLVTHSGLFTNELWICIGMLIVSISLASAPVPVAETTQSPLSARSSRRRWRSASESDTGFSSRTNSR